MHSDKWMKGDAVTRLNLHPQCLWTSLKCSVVFFTETFATCAMPAR